MFKGTFIYSKLSLLVVGCEHSSNDVVFYTNARFRPYNNYIFDDSFGAFGELSSCKGGATANLQTFKIKEAAVLR
ncbi:MAG: hypothetical protein CME10_15630 [Gemmatimonadetes bacterium]|nr:hypothetical protein [Gemmatimonadota bacterium]